MIRCFGLDRIPHIIRSGHKLASRRPAVHPELLSQLLSQHNERLMQQSDGALSIKRPCRHLGMPKPMNLRTALGS